MQRLMFFSKLDIKIKNIAKPRKKLSNTDPKDEQQLQQASSIIITYSKIDKEEVSIKTRMEIEEQDIEINKFPSKQQQWKWVHKNKRF